MPVHHSTLTIDVPADQQRLIANQRGVDPRPNCQLGRLHAHRHHADATTPMPQSRIEMIPKGVRSPQLAYRPHSRRQPSLVAHAGVSFRYRWSRRGLLQAITDGPIPGCAPFSRSRCGRLRLPLGGEHGLNSPLPAGARD